LPGSSVFGRKKSAGKYGGASFQASAAIYFSADLLRIFT
jgi:hypothetical protein